MTVFDSDHNCSGRAMLLIEDYQDAKETLPILTDINGTLGTFSDPWSPPVFHAIKIKQDIDRYAKIIEEAEPEVIVELGTSSGGAAQWYASLGLDVVTVDIVSAVLQETKRDCGNKVQWIIGDSIDQNCYNRIRHEIGNKRCMLSIDSDHNACHVLAEMHLYNQFVSPGCYMVVEDGIFRWLPEQKATKWPGVHSPLSAIEAFMAVNHDFVRDEDIEMLHPITMNPCGWLRRAQ